MRTVEQDETVEKVVLVTGASHGIGRVLAQAAAVAGYRVVANYRSEGSATTLIADIERDGGQAHAIRADVGSAEDVDRLVEGTIARFGRIDCVVNNAGVGERIELEAIEEETLTKTLHDNLTSAFLVSQAAWPHMRLHGGRLVFCLQSQLARAAHFRPLTRLRKGCIEGLIHAYAAALLPFRITANAIAPAFIESDMIQAFPTQSKD